MTREIQVQDHFTPAKGRKKASSKPKILLCGKWLEAAGIYAGDRVTVNVLDDQIIISTF